MGDTEWDDILIKYGIKNAPKKEEPECVQTSETNEKNENFDLETLDDADDDIIRQYRDKRLAELRASALLPRFGDVREITASDYIEQVNNAGHDIWVVLLLYEHGIPECTLLSQLFERMAKKHANTKFLKSISKLCVEKFPESSLPAIFVYQNGCLNKQLIGNATFGGMKATFEMLEWLLSKTGAIVSDITDPRTAKASKKMYECFDENDV